MLRVEFILIGVPNGKIVASTISNDAFSIQKSWQSAKSVWTSDRSKASPSKIRLRSCSSRNQCKMPVQSRAFEAQLQLAAKWNKPIVIHSRDAYPETFTLMKEVRSLSLSLTHEHCISIGSLLQYLPSNHKIHLHCFVGNLDDVDLFTSYFTEIKFGFTPLISRNTFLHPVLQQLELTQILCETDSPYFIPDEVCLRSIRSSSSIVSRSFLAFQLISLCTSGNGL